MKKIGLVGGLSWVSTAEYYRLLNQMTRDVLGGHHSAPILLESLNEQEFLSLQSEDLTEHKCEQMIVSAVQRLLGGGAEVIALCANGIHRFASSIEHQCQVELIHIAKVTACEVSKKHLSRVGLLGVLKTMEGTFYPQVLNQHDIEVLIPEKEDRLCVHDLIISELVFGNFTDRARSILVEICSRLHHQGAQGVILGCTEIPLLMQSVESLPVPLFSTTDLHCRAIVEAALL